MLEAFLNENNFLLSAQIARGNPKKEGFNHIFNFVTLFDKEELMSSIVGWVYVWVEIDKNSNLTPLYVGKAGVSQTLKKRFYQHERSFYSNVTGIPNAKKIDNILKNKNFEIAVFARHSPTTGSAFGINAISLCELEEIALIKKFRNEGYQLWNK